MLGELFNDLANVVTEAAQEIPEHVRRTTPVYPTPKPIW